MGCYKYIKRKALKLGIILGLAFPLVLTGCGDDAADNKEKDGYVAVICKSSQHEFWRTMEKGAMDAGEELNLKVTFEAPEDESHLDDQIALIEKAIDNRADAIVLAPLDTDKLNDVVEKAVDNGIPVITLDSDITSGKRLATIGTNNVTAGAIAARYEAQLIDDKGQVAIIGHVEGAQTAIERMKGFVDEINVNHQDIEIVEETYTGGDVLVAYDVTKRILTQYPDLKGLYATNEGSAVGAARAVEEMGLSDKIIVIGFDSSDDEISYLKKGVIDGMMVQNPYNMGYLGVRNIYKAINGSSIEKTIDTGAIYVNRDNLMDEDIQWYLYPLGKN
ncbi:MAG: ABC transporter substrate-binding protein [Lachnospiraceae bacterium]|nr:ABC transporter substrate-binding protein [Lachnospiraceae bacterium]